MTHSSRASAALRALTEADPALAALSLWCAHRDHDGVTETAGTEIRYGPGFATLPLHEQIGVAGHHILHVALQHSSRMQAMAARLGDAFQPDLWGIAADAIVNEVLLAAGHALPRPALTLTGLLLATTGKALPPAEALAEWDVERLYLSLQGGGAGGQAAAQARAHASAQGHDLDLKPAPTDAAEPADQTKADWRAHLTRAMAAGQAAGFGIGRIGRRLADLPQPRVPWDRVLRRLLARATLPHPMPSHRRPARAWLATEAEARRTGTPVPVFEPGLARSQPVPRLVVGLDCSTSTEGPLLDLFLAEITGIARRMAAEVHVIPFDETAHPALRLDLAGAAAQIRGLQLPQGGGTDFRPLIQQAQRLAPSALVILTDLDGPCGPDPRLPVIWAVPDTIPVPSAPFGHVLALSH